MKRLLPVISLCCVIAAKAELRTFTNSAGKAIQAELVAMEGKSAVLKLGNGRTAKVPLKSLSEDDQNFIKTWWEENKNNLNESDVRLKISKNTKSIRAPRVKGKKPDAKTSKSEVTYTGVLSNNSQKTVSDITVEYTVYKRTSSRGANGSNTSTREVSGSTKIKQLEANGSATFETTPVVCVNTSKKGAKGGSEASRESVQGIVVTFSVGENEFLKQGHPDRFLDRLMEEEKRQESRDRER